MRLLVVHADRLAFEATRPVEADAAEDPDAADREGEFGDCVAAFCAVEAGDGADSVGIAARAAEYLSAAASERNADRVVVLPCPVLADDPGPPALAARILGRVADRLDRAVARAPAGWYVDLECSREAHPLSEAATRIRPADGDSGADGSAPTDREWMVVSPDGTTADPDATSLDPRIRRVLDAEQSGGTDAWPSVPERLRGRGLVERDRFSPDDTYATPRGVAVLESLRALLAHRHADAGHAVRTTGRVDPDAAPVSEHLAAVDADPTDWGSIPETTAVGHRSVLADAEIDAADLPVRVYSLGGRSPGVADANAAVGEDVSPPLVTAARRDESAAREEFCRQVRRIRSIGADLGVEYVGVLCVPPGFRSDHRDWIAAVASALGGPIAVAGSGNADERAVVLETVAPEGDRLLSGPTVRVDAAGAGRFGIEVAGREASPVLVESTPVANPETVLAAAVDAGLDRDPPRLPCWLSPTQVRLVPVAADHRERCHEIATDLKDVRVDVDDRPLSVGERLDRAAAEWVPYRVVVGDRAREGTDLAVHSRATGREVTLPVDRLHERILADVDGRPGPTDPPVRSLADGLSGVGDGCFRT